MSEQLYYADYLQLERILDAQHLESEKKGRLAHDEMLFIIVHQAYELWFKQMLWDLDSVLASFGDDTVEEHDVARAVSRLSRIIAIERLMLRQPVERGVARRAADGGRRM